jgi:hypothetical protein
MVIGPGLFVNWFYQVRIGLDMFYFWRKQMPIILTSMALTALLCVAVFFLPITGLGVFCRMGPCLLGSFRWSCLEAGHERGGEGNGAAENRQGGGVSEFRERWAFWAA